MSIWAMLIGCYWLLPATHWLADFVLAPINLEFTFGIIAANAIMKRRATPAKLLLFVAAATMLIFFEFGLHRIIFGLAVALAIVPLVCAEQAGRLAIPAFLILLGEASYSLYLIHGPLISATSRIAATSARFRWAGLGLAATVSVIAALIYHLLYERPTVVRLKDRCPGTKGPATAPI
jgi:peptidoglycan/LPS O-acetylase OafA/YrhL